MEITQPLQDPEEQRWRCRREDCGKIVLLGCCNGSLIVFAVALFWFAGSQPHTPQAVPLPCSPSTDYTSCSLAWEFAGPAGTQGPGNSWESSMVNVGAVQQVTEGPPGIWFAASVNGGLWRCKDLSALRPVWQPVLDGQPVRCSSMSAIARHRDDADMLFAGCGASTSGEQGPNVYVTNSGDWGGVIVSRDAGDTWAMTAFPVNWYVTAIVSMGGEHWAVATAAQYFEGDTGGVWISSDGGKSWKRTLEQGQAFELRFEATTGTLIAAVANVENPLAAVQSSTDKGRTWAAWGEGLEWDGYHIFYATLGLAPATESEAAIVFFGFFAHDPNFHPNTSSAVFWREIGRGSWQIVTGQPMNLDADSMPKDRMAIMADPSDKELLYVAGNGEAFAWRVEWRNGVWHDLVVDTQDGTKAHGDCRNWAWDSASGGALLTSDGGVFLRSSPGSPGGSWTSLNGDMRQMEMLEAKWDARLDRWIGGAQDNCVQLSPAGAPAEGQSLCLMAADGTVMEVDNVNEPTRLFGSTQFLGGARVFRSQQAKKLGHPMSSLPGDCQGAFCFTQGTPGIDQIVVDIPLSKWFEDEAFPYFVHDFKINSQNTTELVFWAKGTASRLVSGWYVLEVPVWVNSSEQLKEPREFLSSEDGNVFAFVAGGTSDGEPDRSLIVGINDTHLYHRSAGRPLRIRPLPSRMAEPVMLHYDASGDMIIGPVSHARTAFLAVSPRDSRLLAVSGWPSVQTNNGGPEGVWLTADAGATWANATGNLLQACATVARARPSGLLLVDFPELSASALLVGTVSGPFISWTDEAHLGRWSRLGTCADLPLVLVMGLSYEPYSDVLLAATYGRGVFVLRSAKAVLLRSRRQQEEKSCEAGTDSWSPASSAAYFPEQLFRSKAQFPV